MVKSVPIAAAGLATLAVVGSAVLGATTATAANDDGVAPQAAFLKAQVSSCSGHTLMAMSSRAMDFQNLAAGATSEVEGSQWQVRGPKKGTDTVLVTLSSMAASGGPGELTTVALYRDGVGTAEGSKYLTYNGVLDQTSVQFCARFGKGQHTFALRVSDGGGGATTMYYPTITYQRFS